MATNELEHSAIKFKDILNPDNVQDYLLTHPVFLESFVIGPHISRETFQRWTFKRNSKIQRDSRRQLLSNQTILNERANICHILYERTNNYYELLYELAVSCAQITQIDNFELLVRTDYQLNSKNNDSTANGIYTTNSSGIETERSTSNIQKQQLKQSKQHWYLVVRSTDNSTNTVKLEKIKNQKKLSIQVLKLIACNKVIIGEIHFFSIINDRDMQFIQILSTWVCSLLYFTKFSNTKESSLSSKTDILVKDGAYINRQRRLNSFLLDVVKSIFQNMITMDTVILKVMNFAQKLVDADRASLFLVDNKTNEIYARIFDIIQPDSNSQELDSNVQVNNEGNKEIRFPIGKGIAGHVALTGESLNISNAYEDERFNREIDSKTGYHTKTILCMPIFLRNNVIGVVQMVNKHNGIFTQTDEEAFETFANYCGLALHHARLYDKIRKSEQKYRVALEVLAYHNVCNRDEVNRFKKMQLPEKIVELEVDYERDDLIRFILTVRKNYRKVPYHNWTHGWTVAHAMFVFLLQNNTFSPKERLALFVAAICHDLDHRGKNNAYMKLMSTPLASIYSTSVMEHHHFNQTVTILQQDGHNILKSLRSKDYKEVLGLIRHCILATDLALFFPNRSNLSEIVKLGNFEWNNLEHRALVQAILMTACDLVASAKPWKIQTETVKVIFEEFYEQGDAEKINGRDPVAMMDRNKAHELPKMQVDFIRGICMPCYEVLLSIFPEVEKLYERTKYNAIKWEQLHEEYKLNQENKETVDK